MRKHITALLFSLSVVFSSASQAFTVGGTASIYDPGGVLFFLNPISAEVDLGTNTVTVDPFLFFGSAVNTQPFQLLGEGVHTRPIGSITVGPGQLGAYVTVEWNVNTFSTFMVWDAAVATDGISLIPVDSDGDGTPGQQFVEGPFPGFTLIYELISPDLLPPGVDVAIDVEGGDTSRACSEPGGTSVTMTANAVLRGGAELLAIEWFLDDTSVGTGEMLTQLIPVGTHTVKAVASTTTGQSDQDSVTFNVFDFTAPDVSIGFIDARSGDQITGIADNRTQYVTPVVTAADLCDAEPDVTAVASPVFAIAPGSQIMIQGNRGSVQMPASGLEVRATATDDAGNSRTETAVLPITQ